MLTKDELPECPVATTVQLIGNKWKLLIIRNLLGKTQRFTDFVKTIPGISKKVLTDNLRALESDGLIEREVFAEVPPRVEYSLSALGKTLKPIRDAMWDWGTGYKAALGPQRDSDSASASAPRKVSLSLEPKSKCPKGNEYAHTLSPSERKPRGLAQANPLFYTPSYILAYRSE